MENFYEFSKPSLFNNATFFIDAYDNIKLNWIHFMLYICETIILTLSSFLLSNQMVIFLEYYIKYISKPLFFILSAIFCLMHFLEISSTSGVASYRLQFLCCFLIEFVADACFVWLILAANIIVQILIFYFYSHF